MVVLCHLTAVYLTEFVGVQYTVAFMGYGPEDENAVLELTYNYGVTNYDKGNGYAQVGSVCFYSQKRALMILFYLLN